MTVPGITLLEVCVDGIEGLLTAQENGADRLELCSALSEGGLTPSYGLIRQAAALARVPVHVLVRPRGGHFVYTRAEQQVMLDDVAFVRGAGVQGVVIGGLDASGKVDLELTRQLKAAAGSLSVTFHRAFDEVPDPFAALDDLMALGIDRILTSGGASSGLAGREQLHKLQAHAGTNLTILGCGSLRPENIAEVQQVAALREVHFAARFTQPDGSIITDGALVQQMKALIEQDGV